MAHIKCSKWIKAPRSKVYSFLLSPENLNYLLGERINVDLVNAAPSLSVGAEYTFTMTRYRFAQKVKIKFIEVQKESRVTYKQSYGLFKKWVHTQIFEDADGGTLVTDYLEFNLPFGLFGLLLDDLFVIRDMTAMLKDRLEKAALKLDLSKNQEDDLTNL